MAQQIKSGDDVTALMNQAEVKSGDDVTHLMNSEPVSDVEVPVTKEPTEPTVDTSQLDPEQQSIFDKAVAAWHQQTSPLVDLTPKMKEAQTQFSEEHPYIGPALKTGLDLLLGMTSPLNIETAGVGMGEAAAAKFGLPLAAKGLNLVSKGLSGGMAVEGGSNLFGKDKSLGERLSGGLEMLLGARGMKSSPRVAEIAESKPSYHESPGFPEGNPKTRFYELVEKEKAGTLTGDELKEAQALNKQLRDPTNQYGETKPDLRLQLDETGKTTGAVNTQADKVINRSNSIPSSEASDYITDTKGMTREQARFNKFLTGAVDFPEEVFTELSTLAKEYRKYSPGSKEAATIGKQMIEIKDFMEGSGKFKTGLSNEEFINTAQKATEQQFDPASGKPLESSNIHPKTQTLINKKDNRIVTDKKQSSAIKEAMMLPKGLMASWDLSAPGRQALPLMLNKEWWTSWGSMVKAGRSEEAFKSIQQAIADKPLFRDYGQGSLAKKVGLHLTDLTDLSSREEQLMSNWAEKFPGVRASNRAYTAYLNKLRADTFERLMNDAKVLGINGEYDLTAAKKIANFVNVATGRGSLGSLEKYATELNTVFFSPRLIASRLQILDRRHYWAAPPALRKQAIKSLFAIAGTTNLVGEMIKNTGAGTVENNPTSSDFRKYKIGNTRIDPFGGFQQYVVLAARLLENQSKSSVSGKTTELGKGYRAPDRLDVLQNFGESKLNPAISLAEGILRGKNFAGKPIDIPEEIAQRFVPLFLQDLKSVATENPNLIPGYSDMEMRNFDPKRMMLALPGAFGAGIQNYPSR